jgi:hypothetical protein
MSRKKKDHETLTTDFEVDGIEEAFAPAPAHKVRKPGEPFRFDAPKLEVETPPELREKKDPEAKIWILERRARGLIAGAKRWIVEMDKKRKTPKRKRRK